MASALELQYSFARFEIQGRALSVGPSHGSMLGPLFRLMFTSPLANDIRVKWLILTIVYILMIITEPLNGC